MSFGKNLHDLRIKNDLNQFEFAQSIGITQAVLSRYENETIKPNIETLLRIVNKYHVTLDCLFDISLNNRFNKISDVMYALVLFQNIGGANCSVNITESDINFSFKKDEKYSKQICDFFENYLSHKNDFDLIPDEEIRKMSYDVWLQKQLEKYNAPIHSKEEYNAAQDKFNKTVNTLVNNYGKTLNDKGDK